MTKPFTPEFRTRADAIAYIENGRGNAGLVRPTKDAWNTEARKLSGNEVGLFLHNDLIIRWFEDPAATGSEVIWIAPARDFTTRKRINDYALAQFGMRLDGPTSRLIGPMAQALGNFGLKVTIPGSLGMVSPSGLEIDDTGKIRSGLLPLIGKKIRKADHLPQAEDWIKATKLILREGQISEDRLAPWCINCSDAGMGSAIGSATQDTEHLFAHMHNTEISPSFLRNVLRISSALLNATVSGSIVSVGPVSDASHLEYIETRMKTFVRSFLR